MPASDIDWEKVDSIASKVLQVRKRGESDSGGGSMMGDMKEIFMMKMMAGMMNQESQPKPSGGMDMDKVLTMMLFKDMMRPQQQPGMDPAMMMLMMKGGSSEELKTYMEAQNKRLEEAQKKSEEAFNTIFGQFEQDKVDREKEKLIGEKEAAEKKMRELEQSWRDGRNKPPTFDPANPRVGDLDRMLQVAEKHGLGGAKNDDERRHQVEMARHRAAMAVEEMKTAGGLDLMTGAVDKMDRNATQMASAFAPAARELTLGLAKATQAQLELANALKAKELGIQTPAQGAPINVPPPRDLCAICGSVRVGGRCPICEPVITPTPTRFRDEVKERRKIEEAREAEAAMPPPAGPEPEPLPEPGPPVTMLNELITKDPDALSDEEAAAIAMSGTCPSCKQKVAENYDGVFEHLKTCRPDWCAGA